MKLTALSSLGSLAAICLCGAAPRPAAAACAPTVTITEVKYLGKSGGDDRVSVSWRVTPAGECSYAVDGFKVSVQVVRRLGHEDSGSQTVPESARSVTITVPRGVTETDPQSYSARVEASATTGRPPHEYGVPFQGTGAPGPGFSGGQPPTPACVPKHKLDELTFFPNRSGKDAVGVFFSFVEAPPCYKVTGIRVAMSLTREDGSTVSSTGSASTVVPNVRLEFPASAAKVRSYTGNIVVTITDTEAIAPAIKKGSF